jgi:cytochrome c556
MSKRKPLMSGKVPAFVLSGLAVLLLAPTAPAQAPAPTMKQLMLDLIHPASNDILLTVSRGGPSNDKEWASLRHNALTLAESGNFLMTQAQSGSDAWVQAAKLLSGAGSDAYKAAQSKDAKALPAITARIDASCTNCHKQFRPNVFPSQTGGDK